VNTVEADRLRGAVGEKILDFEANRQHKMRSVWVVVQSIPNGIIALLCELAGIFDQLRDGVFPVRNKAEKWRLPGTTSRDFMAMKRKSSLTYGDINRHVRDFHFGS
jgi:hypothetical protein